jgi:pyruvate dehydrogenase E2 component (dihydrolipoamide acetyltransferase)
MAREEFRLPSLGMNMEEAEVLEWLVDVGEEVAEGQEIVNVATDKVEQGLPSPYTGTVAAVHAADGDTVAVGALLATIETA